MNSQRTQSSSEPGRVLVVDDNPDVATSLSDLVDALGHPVFVAHDGAEALALAADCHPSVVLLDIGLPDLSGHDVARCLRDMCTWEMTIVAITGWGQESDRSRSAAAGLDLHLVKPVGVEALRRVLEATTKSEG